MSKRTHDREPAADQRRIRGKDEVRQMHLRFDPLDAHVARAAERFDEPIPLTLRVGCRYAYIPRHPRIDVVRDRKVRWWTHQ